MSTDDVKEGLSQMTESGRLDPTTARAAMDHPIEGEKLLRLERIEQEMARQSRALFGDPSLQTQGLVSDVRELKLIIYRGIWTISGGAALGGFLVLLLGLYLDWAKN